ncbi:MAG: CHRD domain-containing protein [Verrucomicrobiota bacterium]
MKKIILSVFITGSLISVQANFFQYSVTLNGPNESPANGSPGTGFGTVNYDDVAHSLQLQVSFTNLTGTTTASHIHAATVIPGAGTAGVATTTPSFAGFPLGVTFGSFSNTLDLTSSSSWNAAYITANGGTPASAESALASAMAAGTAYWNIHSSTFGGGEIRGFLTPVPEPGTIALAGLSAGALAVCAWKKRRAK